MGISLLLQSIILIKGISIMSKLFSSCLALALMGSVAFAADHQVKMLNKGSDGVMAFEPNYVNAQIGDTITFIPTDKGHDAVSSLVPDGAAPFKGKINEQITYKLEKEGVYVYYCVPHKPMNMTGIIQVGKPVNLEAAKAEVEKYEKGAAVNKGRLTKALANVK